MSNGSAPAAPPPQKASWLITLAVYLMSIACMGTVGAVVPSMAALGTRFAASPAEIALALSMFSLPSALLGILGGWIDRFGYRRTLLVSSILAAIAHICLYAAPSLIALDLAFLLSGIAYTGISIAAPAYLMNVLDGAERARGVSIWATYGPAGYAVGLVLAAPFAMGEHGLTSLLLALGLQLLGTGLALAVLPADRPPDPETDAGQPSAPPLGIRHILANRRLIALALAVGLPTAISYGTGIVAPSYIAEVHHVTIASSAVLVAIAKIVAMIVGGVVVGQLLAKNIDINRLFAMAGLLGVLAQALLFFPGGAVEFAILGLTLWLFAVSGMLASGMMLIPVLSPDPTRRALATGLTCQVASLLCFVSPPLYFLLPSWALLVALAAAGLLLGYGLLLYCNTGFRERPRGQ
jgi:predicted MFS family arabinose efflux permease